MKKHIQERRIGVIVLKAMGQAISKAVAIAEIIKVSVILSELSNQFFLSVWHLH